MKTNIPSLTKSEKQVLEILWKEATPLTSSEIVASSEGSSWKASYIHLLINSLLQKKMIKVNGMKQTVKNYARTFEPTMTKEEYGIAQLDQEKELSFKSLPTLFPALLKKETDEEVLMELEKMLQERRRELAEEKTKKEKQENQ